VCVCVWWFKGGLVVPWCRIWSRTCVQGSGKGVGGLAHACMWHRGTRVFLISGTHTPSCPSPHTARTRFQHATRLQPTANAAFLRPGLWLFVATSRGYMSAWGVRAKYVRVCVCVCVNVRGRACMRACLCGGGGACVDN